MEKLTDYTCNPEYTASCNKLMSEQDCFMRKVQGKCPLASIGTFGEINVVHLWSLSSVQAAYDLKMRMVSYWDIVTQRMVDNMVLHLLFSVEKLVNKEMQKEIINEMMEEVPSVSEKRKKLHSSIDLLKQSKDVVANIMDKIVVDVE